MCFRSATSITVVATQRALTTGRTGEWAENRHLRWMLNSDPSITCCCGRVG
jgi:hypothetical protein